MIELKELAIKEAKELLTNLNNGISKTRDRSWQLLAFVIAIDVYLLKSLIENTSSNLINLISLCAIPFSSWIFYHLYFAILPNDMRFGGSEPEKIKPTMEDGKEYFLDCMMHTYQSTINSNRDVLSVMAMNFKKSLQAVILFLAYCLILIFISIIYTTVRLKCCASINYGFLNW